MTVEIRFRWLLVLISLATVFFLRDSRVLLTGYVVIITIGLLVWAFILPRWTVARERRLHAEILRLLGHNEGHAALALLESQWLLRRLGRHAVLMEAYGLAHTSLNDHDAAYDALVTALKSATPSHRPRIEMNIAQAEIALGNREAAIERYQRLIRTYPDLQIARSALEKLDH